MPELFVFLIKVNASLILFCLAYFFIMRRLTYYKLNRVFLLGGILLSTIYPLFDLSGFLRESPKLIIAVQDQLPAAVQQPNPSTGLWSVLIICFWIGVIILALRMSIRLCSLFKIHKQSTCSKVNSYAVRLVQRNISTFSFWNNIYLNTEQHLDEEIFAVLRHEQVHIEDFHTFDILLGELNTVFYWFNPGAWLMRKAIKENLEFITDQKTLETGIDRKAYQYSMLQASTGLYSSQLITNFNMTAIKRRIVMMNRKRTSSFHLLSYLLVIIVIVFAITAFTVTRVKVGAKLTTPMVNLEHAATRPSHDNGDHTSDPTKSENFNASGKHIKTVSVTNIIASGQLNKPGKAHINLLKTEQQESLQPAAAAGYTVDSTGSAIQVPAKISSKTVGRTGKDTQVHTLENARAYINDKEVSTDQMKSIDPKNILRINVIKNENPAKDAVYIYTKVL
ncbi:MAG: M56 family metallopeptidase [Sphingobacteriaceae bacterium]|nr:MAG: M56 family metallopeptidase [Sphingobacteriaceae bacterium]